MEHNSTVLHCEGVIVTGIAYSTANETCRIFVGWEDDSGSRHIRVRLPVTEGVDLETATEGFDLRSHHHISAFMRFVSQVCRYGGQIASSLPVTDLPHTDKIKSSSLRSNHCGDRLYTKVTTWAAQVRPSDLQEPSKCGHDITSMQIMHQRHQQPDSTGMPAAGLVMTWPSNPNQWILEANLGDVFDLQYPGIAEWSYDHHVYTMGMLRNCQSHKDFANVLDTFYDIFYGLPRYAEASPRSSLPASNGTSSTLPSSHFEHRSGASTLAIQVCGVVEAMRLTECSLVPDTYKPWRMAASWLWFSELRLTTPGSMDPGLIVYCDTLTVEYPRCTEYDEILQTPADFDPQDEDLRIIPHDSESTLRLMSTHRTRTSADKAAMGSDHPTGQWTLAELIEMRHPFNHVEHALDITYTKILDGDRLLDLWNAADIRTARSISTEKMKSRLLRYPLSGPIDDAVVVVLGHFGDELCSAIGHPAAQVVLGTLPFVEPWNISLQGDSDSESPPLPAHSDIPHADHLESTPLCLPVLLSAYQTAGVSLDNATRNRLRLASVGAVRFLAVLGVTDFPVYGLSICGPYGIPSVTWYSSEDKACYTVDRNTARRRFDLTEKHGVLRYLAFLARMREHAQELHRRFEEAKLSFFQRMQTPEGLASVRWTARSQMDDRKLWIQGD
ncbi:uncharacterized protein TRAVEDRAFT_53264 [Trametes versicolor FP-101664 SS1]|uniref:uncharacterized protein n=1 Tax=Trametes versicolor (strain FP-101664) TaxID=717944 RepID=UPI0004623460|nr:uncharacterized protein TRAVEDRAFT_53264 [Trametes versicolor FP-101664 SS1]EIW52825.1 hypothetical protein TRAVEDRAFT_53264 [Trametes versicolor FP-101664 SS1]